ncbi:methionyl-tRNA formyltransferase [Lentisphaerota bacterium WC36G]|nr:methionyl-tRNA formyltransferase [Lentisphaerae bacterium WC36]
MIKVYFLGAGEIAVPVIDKLVKAENINVVGIGTQLDKPAGRKKVLTPTPIGKWGLDNDIEVARIRSVNDETFIKKIQELAPDVILVISFGQLLREEILNLPTYGCVNIHSSILPKYRGASPIITAIINQEKETGVTFMQMAKGLDTGDIFKIFKYPLKGECAEVVEHNLGVLAADNCADVLAGIISGKLKNTPQNHKIATECHKIRKAEGKINWHETAAKVVAKINGFNPWPGAFFTIKTPKRDITIKILEAEVIDNFEGVKPAVVLEANKNNWIIGCQDKAIKISKVIPQGKKEMTGVEFLRGCNFIKQGTILAEKGE